MDHRPEDRNHRRRRRPEVSEFTAGGSGCGGGDRADAAVQMNEEDLLPTMVVTAEDGAATRPPPFRDQMVQVPGPRLPSNTKRCVLTMDGYSYVIGESTHYLFNIYIFFLMFGPVWRRLQLLSMHCGMKVR